MVFLLFVAQLSLFYYFLLMSHGIGLTTVVCIQYNGFSGQLSDMHYAAHVALATTTVNNHCGYQTKMVIQMPEKKIIKNECSKIMVQ